MKITSAKMRETAGLQSNQEEADERLLLLVNHAVKLGIRLVVLVSSDDDTLVCAVCGLRFFKRSKKILAIGYEVDAVYKPNAVHEQVIDPGNLGTSMKTPN